MFKVVLVSFLIFNISLAISPAYAATPTPESSFQELKDQLISNIASRVAQLNLVEKRGIIGRVTEVTNTQITITDVKGDTRFVDVDELTKFSSPNSKGAYGISDITEDTTIGVLGLYNKESRRILARFVEEINTQTILHGGVAAINDEDFFLTVRTDDGKQIIVDIENLTRTYSFTMDDDYIKSGFSKIQVNYNIIITGVMSKTETNRMTATRVIIFPEIPTNPKVNSALENPSNTDEQ